MTGSGAAVTRLNDGHGRIAAVEYFGPLAEGPVCGANMQFRTFTFCSPRSADRYIIARTAPAEARRKRFHQPGCVWTRGSKRTRGGLPFVSSK
jgi:hypothetical protein